MNKEPGKVYLIVLRCDRDDEAYMMKLELAQEALRNLESREIEKIKFPSR